MLSKGGGLIIFEDGSFSGDYNKILLQGIAFVLVYDYFRYNLLLIIHVL